MLKLGNNQKNGNKFNRIKLVQIILSIFLIILSIATSKAFQEESSKAKSYNNDGIDLIKLNKYEKAIKAYDLAIKYKPELAETYYNKGNALKLLNKVKESDESFSKAEGFKCSVDGTVEKRQKV